jgi:uncharacterized protein
MFAVASIVAALCIVVAAGVFRGWPFALFAAVVLGVHTLISVALWPVMSDVRPIFVYLQTVSFIHFANLIRPSLKPRWWRALVSLPAMFFVGSVFLAWPWAVALQYGLPPKWVVLPFIVGFLGLIQSKRLKVEMLRVDLGATAEPGDLRVRRIRPQRLRDKPAAQTLKIVQITDPHLGPFMSVERLRRISQRAVDQQPDLVFLTGDFLTMESHGHADAFADALSPLKAMPGKVFACRGNHDLEAPTTVAEGLARNGIRLLIDEEAWVESDTGPVQIIGADFVWRNRDEHLTALCRAFPRQGDALRILLLHDPGAFKHVPAGDTDLVLSGHTHGGQVGLLSLGLPWTVVSLFSNLPDHGLWGRGTDRLYVHRGTGHYGFPLRLGVPGEESILYLQRT